MKKYSTTIGLDLGDKYCDWALMVDDSKDIQEEGRVRTNKEALKRKFAALAPARVAMEVGPQSPWISRLVTECGHEVIVANPRKLKMIFDNDKKSDKVDAAILARVARFDPELLAPIQHRSEATQLALAKLRARDAAVGARTKLINAARGLAKAAGHKLPKCSAPCFHRKGIEELPESLRPALAPLAEAIGQLSKTIKDYDTEIERMCREDFPETELLRGIAGVGALTALAFILTIETPERFAKSRDVGAFIGTTPRRDQSGGKDPSLGITKAGDPFLRRTLVQAAHYILGNRNIQDSELRQWGLRLAGPLDAKGKHNKRLKKRATVAVARKLAVLMHTLWRNGEVYEPFHQQALREERKQAA